ncbi:hypothetical protein [Polyangium mundeleinium]|uniref:Uncharacterized protein n=1 Tax=Polyangium mundeleinium TaxID=2995306 RepID=A0ABT5ENN1_9BACT|nr:hypothetical protein [Polyangium mundeleinium]MDC0742949.1 hypothetical protein [Polyangium mundeleinium]
MKLPERLRGRLDQMRAMSQAGTITEVVKRAVVLYDVLLSAIRNGRARVILRSSDGTERELLIP